MSLTILYLLTLYLLMVANCIAYFVTRLSIFTGLIIIAGIMWKEEPLHRLPLMRWAKAYISIMGEGC